MRPRSSVIDNIGVSNGNAQDAEFYSQAPSSPKLSTPVPVKQAPLPAPVRNPNPSTSPLSNSPNSASMRQFNPNPPTSYGANTSTGNSSSQGYESKTRQVSVKYQGVPIMGLPKNTTSSPGPTNPYQGNQGNYQPQSPQPSYQNGSSSQGNIILIFLMFQDTLKLLINQLQH